MAAEAARNYRLDVGTALATAITVTAISKASEGVVTATNTFANGDFVLFGDVDGMPELSNVVARIKAVSGTGFTIEGVDTTNFGTFVSATVRRITTWTTLSDATSVDFGAGSVDSLDSTRLLDVTKQSQAGLISQPDVSVQLWADYSSSAQQTIDTAAYAGTILPFRVIRNSAQRRVLSGIPSTIGESVNVNQLIQGSFTIIRRSTRDVKYTT